jgi:hypothetical protein
MSRTGVVPLDKDLTGVPCLDPVTLTSLTGDVIAPCNLDKLSRDLYKLLPLSEFEPSSPDDLDPLALLGRRGFVLGTDL